MYKARTQILIFIVLIVATTNAYSQKKMDTYKMSHFDKEFSIKASERKANGDYSIYIESHSIDKVVKDVLLIIKRDDIETFRTILDTAQVVYTKWRQAAIDNKITELNKDMTVEKIDIDVSFMYQEKRQFDLSVGLKARFKIVNGAYLLIIENSEKLESNANKNIDSDGFYLVFNSTEEIESFISKISQESVKRFHTNKTENHDIFKQ